jgi:hypothetical protein
LALNIRPNRVLPHLNVCSWPIAGDHDYQDQISIRA